MGNQYDYIIIGSGIAGLMTTWHAANKKHSVLLISKGGITQNNTYYAQGGIAAAVSSTDNVASHIADTLKAGKYQNNPQAVEFIIKRAPAAIKEIKDLGIRFAADLKLEGNHSHNRISYHKDSIGKHLIETITKKVASLPNVKVLHNKFVIDLILNKNKCIGISFCNNNKQHSRINYLYGRRVVICTGGIGQIYKKTTNPISATGDGIAIAHRAGCDLCDLRYIQFHPTALDLSQPDNKEQLFLLSETLRGEGAHLLNKNFVRFMEKAHPLAELAPRDILSKQIFTQLKSGPVYLDLRHISQTILKTKYPTIYKTLAQHGIDPARNPIPITPAAHYLCGGIKTDLKARTTIKNLYAVGECASTGLHGANRLASNSLLEAIVMAKQATTNPLPVKNHFTPPTKPYSHLMTLEENPQTINKLKTVMWQNATPLATKKDLQQALQQIQSLPMPKQPSETLNMLQTAELIIQDQLNHS